jgi:multidrug efflux pump
MRSSVVSKLPAGIVGPTFNDEFGETFGNVYAITGDGFSYGELKDAGERIRKELLRVADVAKVELLGEQDEKIFVELANVKIASLGLDIRDTDAGRQLRDHRRAHLSARFGRIRVGRVGAIDSAACGRPHVPPR